MTGFDETVPPPELDGPDEDGTAAESATDHLVPEHDSVFPALDDDPEPDESAEGTEG